jgi:hypothetical protein
VGATARLESLLRLSLASNASFERLSGTRYALAVPTSNADDATVTALRVSYEFFKAMQGRCELDDLRISSVDKALDGVARTATIRTETLVGLLEAAQIVDIVLPTRFHRTPAGPVAASGGHSPLEERRDRLVSASLEAPPARRDKWRKHATSKLVVHHQFEPVWNVQHQAVTTYICAPRLLSASDAPEVSLELEDLEIPERISTELSSLQVGMRYLSEYLEKGDRFLLGIPISFEVISSPVGRMNVASACRGLPAIYRQYLTFVITGLPPGIAQSRLSEFVSVLRPFGKVIATVAVGCRNFYAYQGLGLAAIALDVQFAHSGMDALKADIVHVGAAGRYSKLQTMIYGAGDAAILQQAQAADIHLLHGDAVLPPQDTPKRMSFVPRTQVLPVSEDAGSEDWF